MKYFIFLLYIIAFSISSCKFTPPECQFESIISEVSREHPSDSSDTNPPYRHRILLKQFDRVCADSLTIMTIIQKYLDTTTAKPINIINIDIDDEHWYKCKNSKGYEVEPSWLYCIVQIMMNEKTNKPAYFWFVNEENHIFYEGTQWQNSPMVFTKEEQADKKKAILKMLNKGAFCGTIEETLDVGYWEVGEVCKEHNLKIPLAQNH